MKIIYCVEVEINIFKILYEYELIFIYDVNKNLYSIDYFYFVDI